MPESDHVNRDHQEHTCSSGALGLLTHCNKREGTPLGSRNSNKILSKDFKIGVVRWFGGGLKKAGFCSKLATVGNEGNSTMGCFNNSYQEGRRNKVRQSLTVAKRGCVVLRVIWKILVLSAFGHDYKGVLFLPWPSRSQSVLIWCWHSVRPSIFNRKTPQLKCECQASSQTSSFNRVRQELLIFLFYK